MGTIQRRSQPIHSDVDDDDTLYDTRMPSSTRRYRSFDTLDDPRLQKGNLMQRRASRTTQHTPAMVSNAVAPSPPDTQQGHLAVSKRLPLVTLLIGMIITILLLMAINALASWWQEYQDNLHYGYPRTSQLDAVVGHGDSQQDPTHFIFLNLRGHIEIIEIPGGDASRARIFNGPTLFGDGRDLTPVTGEIRNEAGRHDLIVHIQNQQIVFVNDGTTFHPQQS
ncbi:MAG TPA: hypothetical protein VGL94_01330 [Ktedonobacteraceae bacterium]|jgi:hypothetical protein